MITPTALQWDSPNVVILNILPNELMIKMKKSIVMKNQFSPP
jgi:polygalacturonase